MLLSHGSTSTLRPPLYNPHIGYLPPALQATPLLPELLSRALGQVSSCPRTYPKGSPHLHTWSA